MARKQEPLPYINLSKLTSDLEIAATAATAAIKGMKDGGTCNFDHAMIRIKQSPAALLAIRDAGFHPSDAWGIYQGWTNLNGGGIPYGQGDTRTKAAEVIATSLRAAGYETAVWYAMD